MNYIREKYCKDERGIIKRKMFAIGCSMGGNLLVNLLGNLGEDCYLDAAFIIHSAPRAWAIEETLSNSAYGMHDRNLGNQMKDLYAKHEPVLGEHFKNNLGIDLKRILKLNKPSMLGFDNHITAPAFGYKDA